MSPRPDNLLALLTEAYDAPGGIAQYNRDLLEALSQCERVGQVTCIVRGGGGAPTPRKITQLPARAGKLAYSVTSMRTALGMKPDIVFCGHINTLPVAALAARLADASLWLQLHGIDAWNNPGGIIERLAPQADLVTTVSRHTRQRFLSWARIDPARVRVLPNTVAIPASGIPLSQVEQKYRDNGAKIILTVGRLSASERYKGHDRIIDCLPELLDREPGLQYLIAGDGDDRARLERLARERGVQNHVTFLGKVSEEELDALYRLADLFAMPSTGEGFGIVFLEAMARGTPALGLDQDGSKDPLQDGHLGIVTREGELCNAILMALNRRREDNLSERAMSLFGKQNFNQHVSRLLRQMSH